MGKARCQASDPPALGTVRSELKHYNASLFFQHVVFGICRLIDVLVPDIPESLELKIKRERYLAKQALQDSDTILRVRAPALPDFYYLISS